MRYVGEDRWLISGINFLPTNAPYQLLRLETLKIDQKTGKHQIWTAAPRGFVGEPIFVPRPGSTEEDDGWVLVLVYDAAHHRSDLVILDARNFYRDPIALLHLNYHIPYGLHGNFTPEYFKPVV